MAFGALHEGFISVQLMRGLRFYYYMVICIGESGKVKYFLAGRLWRGKSEKGNFCSASECFLDLVFFFFLFFF